jgi:hypothetical protein
MEILVETEDGPDDFLDVLLLVVRRDDDETVAFVHRAFMDFRLQRY